MKDLTNQLAAVSASADVEAAKAATVRLIEASDATKEKRCEAHVILTELATLVKVQTFAFNFALSGEGLKVL